MEWSGVDLSGVCMMMECNAVEWNGMEWIDGMQCSGVEWNGCILVILGPFCNFGHFGLFFGRF